MPSSVGGRDRMKRLSDVEMIEPKSTLNPLFDYQYSTSMYIREMLEGKAVRNGLQEKRKLIAVPTGSGKTRMVVETLVRWFNDGQPSSNNQQKESKFVLWIAQNTELCAQAFSAFREVFEFMGKQGTLLHLYRFWGTGANLPSLGMEDLLEKGVIVSSMSMLYSMCRRDPAQLKRLSTLTSCIIIDEAHHSVAKSYTQVLKAMGFNRRLRGEISSRGIILIGLTATPFRGSGDNEETQELLRLYGGVHYPTILSGNDGENIAPHAIIDCPKTAAVGELVWVLGERSYDRDGILERYQWSVTGTDDDREVLSHTESNLTVKFWKGGTYKIALKVTDNEGSVGECGAEIWIHPNKTKSSNDMQRDLYRRLIQRKVLSNVFHYIVDSPVTKKLAKNEINHLERFGEFGNDTLKNIANNSKRNNRILNTIYMLTENGRRNILFFGCSVAHSRHISTLLKIKYNIKSACIDSKSDPKSRTDYVESFRRGKITVLCNYDILTAGFDAPNVDCVFVGRPVKSTLMYTQMIGRGMRGTKIGGTADVLVADVDDNIQLLDGTNVEFGWKVFRDYWQTWKPHHTASSDTEDESMDTSDPDTVKISNMTHRCESCGIKSVGADEIKKTFAFECNDSVLLEIYRDDKDTLPQKCGKCRISN